MLAVGFYERLIHHQLAFCPQSCDHTYIPALLSFYQSSILALPLSATMPMVVHTLQVVPTAWI